MDRACNKNGVEGRTLVGNSEESRLLGGQISRWTDNIKMVLREIGRDGMD
jgi:hypothetical protein